VLIGAWAEPVDEAAASASGQDAQGWSFGGSNPLDIARACDAQFPSVQMARVGADGSLSVDVQADQTQDVRGFARCYWQGIAQRVEHRRQAGLPLPDPFDLKPSVDVAPEQGR
jgi:hypothetical protein